MTRRVSNVRERYEVDVGGTAIGVDGRARGDYGTGELLDPFLRNKPREWDDDLVDAKGQPIDPASLLPNPRTHFLTPAQMQAREAMARRRWFLLRNTWAAVSPGTGRVETYFTKEGVERPFRYPESITAFIRQRLDPTARTVAQIDAIFGHLVATGVVEPISTARAEALAVQIYGKTRGQVDLFAIDGR